MELYESVRCVHDSYIDENGKTVFTVKYYIKREGETKERHIMTSVGYSRQ